MKRIIAEIWPLLICLTVGGTLLRGCILEVNEERQKDQAVRNACILACKPHRLKYHDSQGCVCDELLSVSPILE